MWCKVRYIYLMDGWMNMEQVAREMTADRTINHSPTRHHSYRQAGNEAPNGREGATVADTASSSIRKCEDATTGAIQQWRSRPRQRRLNVARFSATTRVEQRYIATMVKALQY